jgi:DNA invertase Pin-like site-specific DNA recombinase
MYDAISYKRFSSPKQARGDTDRRQTELTEDYCRRHNLKLADTYLDAGLSGFTGQHLSDRGALRALLEAAKAGKFKPGTHLIVEALDRLSRQEISTAVRLFLDILDMGLVIVTLIDGEQVFSKARVDNDLTAIVIAIVFLSRANNEARVRRERALQAQQTARKKARQHKTPISAECPRWLTLVGKGDGRHCIVDRNRARVVEHVFRLAASGMGQLLLARYLNDHHVPTFGGVVRWRPGMLAHLLKNRAVLGEYLPHLSLVENGRRRRSPDPEGPIKGYYPTIVDEELFKRARFAVRARRKHNGRRVVPAYSNLLTRLGRCAICGDSLYLSQTKDGFAYLRCVNVRERVCSNNKGFPYRKLETVLLALDRLSELVVRLQAKCVSTTGSIGAADEVGAASVEHQDFLARFGAAIARLGSSDINERHHARGALVAEFRALFEGVVLHPDRIVTLHKKPDASGCRVVYALGSDGLRGVQVRAVTGTTGFIPPNAVAGLIRPVQNGVSKLGTDSLPWQPRSVDDVLQNIQIIQSPNGDWQPVPHDPAQMATVVAQAEHALVGEPLLPPRLGSEG